VKTKRKILLFSNQRTTSCILCLLYYFTFCVLSATLVFAYPEGWSDDILLTPEDDAYRVRPDIAVDTFNNVWVVWDSASWTAGEIYYTKRDSMGAEIIPETNISNNASRSLYSKIATYGDNIHVIWRDMTTLGIGVWHTKLNTDGSVVVPAHNALDGAGTFDCTLLPGLAINKYHELNIIWDEQPVAYREMYWTRLDSMGEPILDKVRVSPENIQAAWPGIGVDSFANVHCGFRTNVTSTDSLTYTKLDRNGIILIDNDVLWTGLLPTFVADRSQNIHVVYMHVATTDVRIEYLKLDQAGNILIWPRVLSIHESNSSPHMAIDSLQYLHVVWSTSQNQGGVMYTKLDTLGDFVIPPMMIVTAPPAIYPALPRVTVDVSNRLHVVWMDQRLGGEDIYYKRGENEEAIHESEQGSVWSKQITVSPNPFKERTEIAVESKLNTALQIYDASGRLVKEFPRSTHYALRTTRHWYGTDDNGTRLPAGVYFIRPTGRDTSQATPVVLLR